VHGRTWDASLEFNSDDSQVFLYPFTGTVDMNNHYFENWNIVMGFYFQDTQDSTNLYRQDLIQNADILARLFLATIYPIEGIFIENIRIEPKYRQMAGTYSGMILNFSLQTVTDLCSITVDDIIIPPVETLCEAVRACVGSVTALEFSGENTATYTKSELIGKEVLLVDTDVRIRKSSDYTFDTLTGEVEFISVIQSAQKIYILYK
jgi:hypothetical protein